MFAARYFNPRYWAARYWTKVGGEIITPTGYLSGSVSIYPALTAACSINTALTGEMNVKN